MRLRTIMLVTLVGAAIAIVAVSGLASASAALTSTAAKDPNNLILKAKDFPAHSDYEAGDELDYRPALEDANARVAGYYAGTYSDSQGHLQLHGAVITTGDVKSAEQAFKLAEKHLQSTWNTTGAVYKSGSGVSLYGDKQDAFSKPATVMSSTGGLAIVVRRGATVWVLWALLDHPDGSPPKASELTAGLKVWASKQRARIGAG